MASSGPQRQPEQMKGTKPADPAPFTGWRNPQASMHRKTGRPSGST